MSQVSPRVSPRTTALAAVTAVILLATLAAGSASAVAIDDSTEIDAADNVSAERLNGSTVSVTVNKSVFPSGTDRRNATINLSTDVVDEVGPVAPVQSQTTPYRYHVPVADLSTAGQNLSSATLTVTPQRPNATSRTVEVDLRSLTFGSADEATLNHSMLSVPVQSSLGIANEQEVRVDPGTSTSDPVRVWSADVDENGTGWIRVSLGQLDRTALLNETYALTPAFEFESGETLQVNPRAAAENASFERTNAGLRVDHPLVFGDTEYATVVETSDPEGRFVRAMTPAEDGRLVLPANVLLSEQREVTLSPIAYPTTLFTATNTSSRPERPLNGSGLDVEGLAPSNLSTVWIDNGTTITADSSLTVTDGFLNLSTAFDDPPESVLLQGDSIQPVEIGEVNVSGTDASGTSSENTTGTSSGAATDQGNSSSAAFLEATAVEPSFQQTSIVWLLLTFLVGAVCALVGILLDDPIPGDGYGMAGGAVVGLTVFGVGVGHSLGGGQFAGSLSFVILSLVFVVVLILTYLILREILVSGPASQRNALIALGIASVVSVLGVILVVVVDQDASLLALGGVYGTVTGAATVVAKEWSSNQSQQTSGTTAVDPTVTTTVEVIDQAADSRIDVPVDIFVEENSGLDPRERRTSDGVTSFELSRGGYTIKAKLNGVTTRETVQIDTKDRTVTLDFGPREVAIAVEDANENSLPNAEVTATAGDDWTETHETNRNGRAAFEIPATFQSMDVTVSRAGYASKSTTIQVASQRTATLDLQPLTGSLTATVSVDDQPVSGYSVEVTPERIEAVDTARDPTKTDSQGRARYPDLPVGDYRVSVKLPDTLDGFVSTDQRVPVTEEESTELTVPIRFEFTLSNEQRRRISSIRSTLDDLSTASSRDTVIPAYYASVVESVLGTVESLPENGYQFLSHRANPAAVADSLLDASEAATEQVDVVMGSKRNVDLFSACSGLSPANVKWEGSVDVETVLTLADRDVSEQRSRFADRLDDVDEVITDELSGLAETSPAREMWDGSRTLVRENTSVEATAVDSAAVIVTARALLDAVEQLFEHEPLRERMKQTVF